MKIFIFVIVLFYDLVFSQTNDFDFDNKLSKKPIFLDKMNLPGVGQLKDNFVERKLFRVLENGATEEVLPLKDEKGRTYYKFKPNDKFYSRYKCNSSDASLTYKVCEKYVFYPKYGGHNHDENIPPYTDWNNQQLTNPVCSPVTQVNNYSYIYFKAPEFATRVEHTIQFYGACSGTYYDIVDIKIDGLVLLQPAWQDSLHGGATYYQLVGETPSHPVNHFARPQTIDLLKQIAWEYYTEFPTSPVLCINDISLIWGGKFDIYANWTGEHTFHRYGRQVDLRIWTIPPENRERLKEIACKYGVEMELHRNGLPQTLENVDFSWVPCQSKDADELDLKYKVPHYHLKFPKFDTEIENPPDEVPNCGQNKN